jgi:hypothetical protein
MENKMTLPVNCSILSEDEMRSIEGGGIVDFIKTVLKAIGIDITKSLVDSIAKKVGNWATSDEVIAALKNTTAWKNRFH